MIKTSSSKNSTSFSLKPISCEICKTVFPDYVKYNNQKYCLWDFDVHTYKSYITFESIPLDKQTNRSVFTVNMEDRTSIKLVS